MIVIQNQAHFEHSRIRYDQSSNVYAKSERNLILYSYMYNIISFINNLNIDIYFFQFFPSIFEDEELASVGNEIEFPDDQVTILFFMWLFQKARSI